MTNPINFRGACSVLYQMSISVARAVGFLRMLYGAIQAFRKSLRLPLTEGYVAINLSCPGWRNDRYNTEEDQVKGM